MIVRARKLRARRRAGQLAAEGPTDVAEPACATGGDLGAPEREADDDQAAARREHDARGAGRAAPTAPAQRPHAAQHGHVQQPPNAMPCV